MSGPEDLPRAAALTSLLLAAAIALAVAVALQPPAVLGRDAALDQFSAERAVALLDALSPNGAPRPVGSTAGARFRDGLAARLDALGFEIERQRVVSCTRYEPVCAPVDNIIARWTPPHASGPPVVLAAHSDSVPAGPGAADDGSSATALVEVARALRAGQAPSSPVTVLITDGEEIDLLGARAALGRIPRVAAVVNLEARGTTGRSWMFEVSDSGGWLVDRYTAVPHPATTSVAAAVYRAMPNGTDLSVFRNAGWPGLGLAFIGGPTRYHTPRDDRAHLDLRSVQHSGETALALARTLGRGPRAPGERVFFDLLGRVAVVWPAAWMAPMAGAALVLVLALWGVRRPPGVLRVAGATLAAVAFGGAAGAGTWWLLEHLGLLPGSFPATLSWGAATAAAAAVALSLLVGGQLAGRVGPMARLCGVGLVWTVAGLVASIAEPGAGYLLVLPAAAAAVAGLRPHNRWLLALPLAVSTLLWTVLPLVLPGALGGPAIVVVGLVSALLATWLLPPLRGHAIGLGTAGLALALGLVTALITPYTADRPSGLNVEDFVGRGLHLSGVPVPGGLAAPGSAEPLSPPQADVVGQEGDRTLLRLHPARAAQRMRLSLEQAAAVEVRYPGLPAATLARAGPWTFWAVPTEGVVVVVEGHGAWRLTEIDPGLPDSAAPVAASRPDWAVPIQWGDVTLVAASGRL